MGSHFLNRQGVTKKIIPLVSGGWVISVPCCMFVLAMEYLYEIHFMCCIKAMDSSGTTFFLTTMEITKMYAEIVVKLSLGE